LNLKINIKGLFKLIKSEIAQKAAPFHWYSLSNQLTKQGLACIIAFIALSSMVKTKNYSPLYMYYSQLNAQKAAVLN